MRFLFLPLLLAFFTSCLENNTKVQNPVAEGLSKDSTEITELNININSARVFPWLERWLRVTNTDTSFVSEGFWIHTVDLESFEYLPNQIAAAVYTKHDGVCAYTWLATFRDSTLIAEEQIALQCDGDGEYYYQWKEYSSKDFINYNCYTITNHLKNTSLYDESGKSILKDSLGQDEIEMIYDTVISTYTVLPDGKIEAK